MGYNRKVKKHKNRKILIIFIIFIFIIIGLVLCCFNAFNISQYFYFDSNKKINNNKNNMTEDWYDISDDLQDSEIINNNISKNIKEIEKQYSNIPVYTDEQGNKYITYESFGTSSEEDFDNYQLIYDAHTYANYYGYSVKATLNTYHIYKLNQTNSIPIMTNTDWNNATFIIHDEDINDLASRKSAIFRISSNKATTTISDKNILTNIKINKSTKKISQLSGYGNAMCIVYNDKKMQFIRYGENQDNGKSQRDFFKIDNEGNVLSEIQWDFDNISEITIIPIPDETITVKNGNFETILPETKHEDESGYFYRNLYCTRSNVIIDNITHTVNNKDYIGGPYKGFINLYKVADITLNDCNLFSHKYENKSNYDLFLEYTINIKINNLTSNDIEDPSRWGIVGTHYTKDITYENCSLNRIDSHTGVHNLTINNCTIGIRGLTLIGSGTFKIANSTIQSKNYLIELRQDYGSTWNGNIYIDNCTYKPQNGKQLIYFNLSYDSNGKLHDFGYNLFLPNIYIDGLKIDDKESNYDDNNLYMFYNDINHTGNEDGSLIGLYQLPQNVFIKNYSTTSGRTIKLFYQKFYNNLDDIGVNYSIPLSYKNNVQIYDTRGNNINSDTITNNNVTITNNKIEGINTNIIINKENINSAETKLTNNDTYFININYSNYVGQKEEKNLKVIIDKDPPQISTIKNNSIYYNSVSPKITDENIKEIILKKNGQVINGYKSGNKITDPGKYELIAKDTAGNETKVEFEILNKFTIDNKSYSIKDKYIIGIKHNTKLKDFDKELKANDKYKISRNNKEIKDGDIIATGDILETEDGQKYYLIVQGDINKDGKTNITDLVKIRRKILSMEDLDEYQTIAADLTNDDRINITDLVRIRRIILGYSL